MITNNYFRKKKIDKEIKDQSSNTNVQSKKEKKTTLEKFKTQIFLSKYNNRYQLSITMYN